VNLRALPPLGTVVTNASSSLGRRLQRPAIDADRSRLSLAPGKLAQQPGSNAKAISIGIIAPQTLRFHRTYNGTFRKIRLIRYY